MPTAEEILASLNDESSDEGENEESPEAQGENSAIRAARKSQREWEKKAKALAKEVEELSSFKAQIETGTKVTSAKDSLTELGLNEKQAAKQAELFLKVHDGEVTPEAVKQFALDYGLVEEAEEQESGPTPVKPSSGFEPGGPGGSPAGQTSNLMSRDDWEALYFRDKDAAMKVANAGKLDLSGTPLGR